MKVSIITIVFNGERTIRDTIESVLGQDYNNVEYIVIDGKSTDRTMDIITSFGNRISQIVSEPDKGIYDAMNKGVKRATGDIVGILNADDFYTHTKVLSKVASVFEDGGIDAVYGDLQYVRPDNVEVITRTWTAGKFQKRSFYYGWMPPHPTFFVRRKVYDRAGLFNTTLRSAADYELMLRFLVKFNTAIKYIPEVLVKMRAGGVSNASLKNRIWANKEDAMAWELNGLKPYFFTTWLKPLRKLLQFNPINIWQK